MLSDKWNYKPLYTVAPAISNKLPSSDATVWNLSLEDIESHSGKILKKQFCKTSELGSSKCVFDETHVLYSKLRPYLNKVVMPDQTGVGTSELLPLKPDMKLLDREFFVYYLRSPNFVDFAVKNCQGANLPRLSTRALWAHCIPLPPLSEQRRIVARIKDLLARVDEIRRLRQEAAKEAEALVSAFSHEIFSQAATEWEDRALKDIAVVNPGRSNELRLISDDLPVTFVPMAAVDEVTGTIKHPEVKPFKEVKKGYTPFLERDVIFAKITPCMQNGKSAVVYHLSNGFGFGSTEFHVIRPGANVMPE